MKKWYQKNWVIILFLIFFFPVGLYLMWKYTDWIKSARVAVTIAVAVIGVYALFTAPPEPPAAISASPPDSIASSSNAGLSSSSTAPYQAKSSSSHVSSETVSLPGARSSRPLEQVSEAESSLPSTLDIPGSTPFMVSSSSALESLHPKPESVAPSSPGAGSEGNTLTASSSSAAESVHPKPEETRNEIYVWVSGKGKKYHSKSTCSNMKSPRQITLDAAESAGYKPCSKCY